MSYLFVKGGCQMSQAYSSSIHGDTWLTKPSTKPLKFLHTEHTLSKEHHVTVGFPLRVFNLTGLQINTRKFLRHLAPTFQNLPWDQYDTKRKQLLFLNDCFPEESQRLAVSYARYYSGEGDDAVIRDLFARMSPGKRKEFEKITPWRRRSIARFFVKKTSLGAWMTHRVSVHAFSQTQETGDWRGVPRVFPDMAPAITDFPEFIKLLARLGQIIEEIHGRPETLEIHAHQMGVIARHGKFGDNAPEGTHKDGTDYIVSALVIERTHIKGAVSTVYGDDKKTMYLQTILQPGQGIFQGDQESPFWHDVSPAYLDTQSEADAGERNIIGFDIRIK